MNNAMPPQEPVPVATELSRRRSTRRRRGERACEFCRLRKKKIRCDQARPQCQNCESRSIVCEYTARPQKPRPSNARIEMLREENIALQAQLQEQQSSNGSPRVQTTWMHTLPSGNAVGSGQPDGHAVSESVARIRPRSTQETAVSSDHGGANPPNDQFHGPTSATFDTLPRSGQIRRSSADIPEIYQKAQLAAETAKQRHLEQINSRQNSFSFGHLTTQQGMALLTLFWNRQHSTGSVVYRPSFMRDMVVGGRYFSPLLLQAMLLYALRCSPDIVGFGASREGSYDAALPFRQEFDRLLWADGGRAMCTSRITTIQALLLMSDVLFARLDERSVAWHYLSIATSMIIDLGMHTEHLDTLPEGFASLERLEIRRRVFWAAYVLDKIQSLYQGRPVRLRDADCNVPALFMDEFEELEPFRTDGYSLVPGDTDSPTYSVSHLKHLCTLSVIADKILHEIYTQKSHQLNGSSMWMAAQSLQEQLDQWHESLPAHLSIQFDDSGAPYSENGGTPLPHVLSLLSMFYALIILLHRPFIPDGYLIQTNETVATTSVNICNKAAQATDALLRWYKAHYCLVTPPYFITYATYTSATIHIRIAFQEQKAGKSPYKPLLTCLEILSSQYRRNRATCRMMEVLLELAKRLEVDIGGVLSENGPRESHTNEQAGVSSGSAISLMNPSMPGSRDDFSRTPPPEPEGSGLDPGDWYLMPELFFDIDPLFGFEAPDLTFDSGLDEVKDTQ